LDFCSGFIANGRTQSFQQASTKETSTAT
jgi:hypothetical protein